MDNFKEAFEALNKAQKQAVSTIEGPVMVVAGPGTGKTQVLALRIAHILKETDAGASSILCLTFTRSGVVAMRDRLARYIGTDARKVSIETFHSFAGNLIEKYYHLLDFDTAPELLDDAKAVLLVDRLLHEHQWKHIRPRTNPAKYFNDLRHLISLLKREQQSPASFFDKVQEEIDSLKTDPENLSSRGPSKGLLKKETEKRIESLERTKEVVTFYELYEKEKKQHALMDYDDVLSYAVFLAEGSEEVRAYLQESYQYILVDEHQDSSGVQNAFLKAVWQEVEKPNIFVVGDDRQLIYGFSGASHSYFEAFKTIFGPAVLITLSENYRSTQEILALADDLLKSDLSKEKLHGNNGTGKLIGLYEYAYERDEILGAARFFEEKIAQGVKPEHCAILVPRNRHVRSAISVLRTRGVPVGMAGNASLFSQPETLSFIRVLHIIATPYNSVLLGESLLDKTSNIDPFEAHTFLHAQKGKEFSLDDMEGWDSNQGLFARSASVSKWSARLKDWIVNCTHMPLSDLIAQVGTSLLVQRAQSHESMLRSVEIVRSLLHSALSWLERQESTSLDSFLEYLDRLRSYNHDIPLASFEASFGVQVMTLHKSKGLEYEYVWIAHMNEETVMAEKRNAFTLPEHMQEILEKRDRAVVTRELYVALTRARRECILSYATSGYDDRALSLAQILADIEKKHFEIKDRQTTEKELLSYNPEIYSLSKIEKETTTLSEIQKFVKDRYTETKVSVTLLNNFFECPWKWYFRNFLKLPEVKGVSLALGSAVHSTIEFILKQNKKPTREALLEHIQQELKKEGVIEGDEKETLLRDALLAVMGWLSTYYEKLSTNRFSERSIQAKDPSFSELQLYGKIDLTETFGDEVVVTDFKTGSVKTASAIEKNTDEGRLSDYMRQLAMYSYLIRLAEKKIVARSRLLFLEAEKGDKHALYETHIGDEQVDLLIRDIKEYDEALKSGEWVNRECRHKGYGEHTECQYCLLARAFRE